MPTQARCDRVPPTDGVWGAIDLRVLQEDDLPLDPRTWGRAEVGAWVSRRGGLPERFPMNGKALCLMSKDMFASRVPRAGHVLHQLIPSRILHILNITGTHDLVKSCLKIDFRRRLAKALALQEFLEKMSSK